MAIIARLYNFVNGQASDADAVDAELNAIVNALNTLVVAKDGTVAMTGALTLPGNPAAALQAAPKQYVDALIGAPAVAGFMGFWGGSGVPAGWLACDGAAVSRSTYAGLFAAIGTTHGAGDGSTTFNVPDLRGRVPMGSGTGSGLTARTAGTKVGTEVGSSDASGLYAGGYGGSVTQTWSLYYHSHNTVIVQPSTVVVIVIKT